MTGKPGSGAMNEPTPKPRAGDAAQAILATGLYDRWYGFCPSDRIGDRPVALTRWGRDLAAWRDRDGAVHLMDDRCPHRGARLSLARNDGDRLVCVYHGAQILGDGTVAAVPGEPGCNLVGKRAVRSYPALEHRGAVFAWYGADPDAPPAAFAPPERLTGDAYEAILCYTEWRCPHRFLIDNNMDPMHGAYLHTTAHSMQQGSRQAEFRTRDTATGFVFEKTGQQDLNFDWSEWYDRDFQAVCLEIPYPATGGPGGNFGIVFHVTPIDEKTSACFFWRHRKVSGWQADVWRFLYRTRLEERHWHVLEQDRLAMETLAADADAREYLYSHDLGLTRVRGLLAREALRQAKAMAARQVGAQTEAADREQTPAG